MANLIKIKIINQVILKNLENTRDRPSSSQLFNLNKMLKRRKNLTILVSTAVAIFIFFSAGAWFYFIQIGKTPGELMDYSELRLSGHPKLEWFALPSIALIRNLLNQPSNASRLQQPFLIPKPPLLQPGNTTDLFASLPPYEPNRRILQVGPNAEFLTIERASRAAKDNDIIEIQAGEYYGDVTVWHQKKLTIRTRGGRARIYAAGEIAEGKAIWVIRNGDFYIENIEFIGAKAADLNGAGIRFEGGNLHLKNCLFYGNENGLLTGGTGDYIKIENSEFAYNGHGDGQSHNLYIGQVRNFSITGSYIHHANVGHLIKSRAQINHIAYNRITDETGGRSSYELNLPNGGVAYVIGNTIQQSDHTQNSAVIAYGEEGLIWPENRLYLSSNTLVNDQPLGGAFLRAALGTQRVVSVNNLLIGYGKYHAKGIDIESTNDIRAGWEIFVQPNRHDYRLNDKGLELPYASPAIPALLPLSDFIRAQKGAIFAVPPQHPGALQPD